MFVGFVVCGYLVFGPARGLPHRLAHGLDITAHHLGEMDYFQLKQVNPVFAPIFFGSFTLLFIFILLNIFFAIMLDAWRLEAEARSQQKQDSDNLDLVSWVRETALDHGWLQKLCNEPKRYVRRACSAAIAKLLGRKNDWMPKAQVLERLNEWKKKKRNAGEDR